MVMFGIYVFFAITELFRTDIKLYLFFKTTLLVKVIFIATIKIKKLS